MNASETERFLMDINAIPRKSFLNEYCFLHVQLYTAGPPIIIHKLRTIMNHAFAAYMTVHFRVDFFPEEGRLSKNCSALRT